MNIRTEKFIDDSEWDKLVQDTYKKPYHFQQQDGCQSRGKVHLEVPYEAEDYENDEIPEVVNGEKMGVSFKAWLARDPKAPLNGEKDNPDYVIKLFWQRNFYPNIQMIANDLHSKGLLEAGEYNIIIDW